MAAWLQALRRDGYAALAGPLQAGFLIAKLALFLLALVAAHLNLVAERGPVVVGGIEEPQGGNDECAHWQPKALKTADNDNDEGSGEGEKDVGESEIKIQPLEKDPCPDHVEEDDENEGKMEYKVSIGCAAVQIRVTCNQPGTDRHEAVDESPDRSEEPAGGRVGDAREEALENVARLAHITDAAAIVDKNKPDKQRDPVELIGGRVEGGHGGTLYGKRSAGYTCRDVTLFSAFKRAICRRIGSVT